MLYIFYIYSWLVEPSKGAVLSLTSLIGVFVVCRVDHHSDELVVVEFAVIVTIARFDDFFAFLSS